MQAAARLDLMLKALKNKQSVDCKINPNAVRTKKISFL
jgi:hypothetical protein